MSQVYQRAKEFDLIHSHVGISALPLASFITATSTVHTLHNNFTNDTRHAFSYYQKQPYISISNSQRQVDLNYVGTVYNGIELADYPFVAQPSEPPYLAYFVPVFRQKKGPHQAIAIAKQSGWRLKMAGKVDVGDSKFFEQEIAPHIDGQQIEYLRRN